MADAILSPPPADPALARLCKAVGRDAMVATTESIVSGAKLHITVRGVLMDLPRAVADLSIRINDAVDLEVLDLFEFTPDARIASVRAFKGPERPVSSAT